MPANYFNVRSVKGTICPGLPGSTETIYSSDIGRMVFKSSNNVVMGSTGSSFFSTSLMLGFIAAVPVTSTGGSTIPIYYTKLDPNVEIEGTYSTVPGGNHPATTDIGKFVGFTRTTGLSAAVFDMQYAGNEVGTSNALWLRITGFSTSRRKIYGYPAVNSSVISW